jgi:hypothetical protein
VEVSVQLPALRAFTTPDVIEQLAEPNVTEYDTAPVPEPPETDNVMPVVQIARTLSRNVKAFCVSFAKVTGVAIDDCDS